MTDRSIGAILADWRALERELAATTDEVAIEDLQARIAALRAEHAAAQAARSDRLDELRRPPDKPTGGSSRH
jgi:hypothetical protein